MSSKASSPYAVARELIDAAHIKDPAYLAKSSHSEESSLSTQVAETHQDELAYADGVEQWAVKLLDSDPNGAQLRTGPGGLELIRLAARCQHLERFLTPRSSYPEGKLGYLKWRRALYTIQADRAKELLSQAGISEEEQNMVHKWVSKTDLKPGKPEGDAGTQLLEDAAVLVFLQDQLSGFAEQHQDYSKEKYISILAKTWKKLSGNAKAAAQTIAMDEPLKNIVAEAIAEVEKKEAAASLREQGSQEEGSSTISQFVSREESREGIEEHDRTATSRPLCQPPRPKTAAEARKLLDSEDSSSPAVFGSRLLKEDDDFLTHNAWDHVEPPAEYRAMIDELLAKQAETKVSLEEADVKYHANAASHWDAFYSQHEHRFFKDRRWLHLEFPELLALTRPDAGHRKVFEIGCGAGNTVFPLLSRNQNPALTIFACDYSAEAVQVVRSNPMYTTPVSGRARAFVWDLSSQAGSPDDEIAPATLDVAVLIFCLSALHPREWKQAMDNVYRMLKPGGLVLVRDYGRHDLPQLRFRKGRMLDDNFYVRGDGTRVYFFTSEELLTIFQATPPPEAEEKRLEPAEADENELSRLEQARRPPATDDSDAPTTTKPAAGEGDDLAKPAPPRYQTLQLAVDRRMLVNRKEQKQMYRCWMQAKFQKI